ncbi:MAG: molybdenum cofactor synthesis domain-containing protein [Halobacteriales archaeon]|jgi:molybdenum cofactor synthesis domain-containing protein
MHVAIITAGDELLAGESQNTNARWLAQQLTDTGCSVGRILTVPDERDVIAKYIANWTDKFDAVVITGGLGGTPDDVTIEAVAKGLNREVGVDEGVREQLAANSVRFAEENPDIVEAYEFDVDLDAAATLPVGSRPIFNDVGWGPGCVVENVYCFPGIPEEMQATFEVVADEFEGDMTSTTLYTAAPEGALVNHLEAVTEHFDVRAGSYPSDLGEPARVKITGEKSEEVAEATAWFRERIDIVSSPEQRIQNPDSSGVPDS